MKKKDKTPLPLKVVRWIYPRLESVFPSLAHRYFVTLFFSPLKYPVPEKERKAETFAEKFLVTVANKAVQCYAWGEGPVVLLVHGWAGRGTQMRRFIKPLLQAGYRVVAFDGPAHGNSEGSKTSIVEFEEALIRIYEKVGEPEAIVAHSFGGSAVLFAAMNGLPVKRLINIASPTIGDEIIKTYLTAIRGGDSTAVFFKQYIQKRYNKTFDEFTTLHFIRHLPKPVALLLVYDEDDREVSIIHAEELQKVYPAAILLRTKGLGHTRILKDNEVIRQVVTFVQQGRLVESI